MNWAAWSVPIIIGLIVWRVPSQGIKLSACCTMLLLLLLLLLVEFEGSNIFNVKKGLVLLLRRRRICWRKVNFVGTRRKNIVSLDSSDSLF